MDGYVLKPIHAGKLPAVLKEFLGAPAAFIRSEHTYPSREEEMMQDMRRQFFKYHEADIRQLVSLAAEDNREALKKESTYAQRTDGSAADGTFE